MPELLEEQRESWGTRGGFILAAIGSAVGLGNLWGFPYKLYSYGGGAFLIPYIIAMVIVGIPLLILEFSLGHFTQRAAPDAFKCGHKRFEFVGWWGIILGFVIVTYYPVILAYCFSFLKYSIVGIFNGGHLPWAGSGLEGVDKANKFFNETYLGKIDGPALGNIRWNIVLPLIITWLSMYLCIFKGVKVVGKIVWLTVSLPWLMLFILTIRGLTLEGSMQGLVYYLNPVWSELANPLTWFYAFGQVFFSLSLAFGVMITYSSFLHRKSDINNNAVIIGLADFATSFIAGLAVFATLGAMAWATQQAGQPVSVENVAETGPSLAFIAFPYALAQLPYSAWFSFVFFFALITLGIDSAFSITESVLASIVDKTGWKRSVVLPMMSIVGLALGLIFITQGGLNWLGTIDGFVNGIRGIAFLGLLECIVLGWLWRIGILRLHANSRSDWKLGKWWDFLIRVVIPIVLGVLFFWQFLDDINTKGFLKQENGSWNIQNCVGLGVLIIAPVLAIAISMVKTPSSSEHEDYHLLAKKGRFAGAVVLIAGLLPWVLNVLLFLLPHGWQSLSNFFNQILPWLFLTGGILATAVAFYLLERHNSSKTQASWLAGWAGIVGTMSIAFFAAEALYSLTLKLKVDQAQTKDITSRIHENLSGVSYIILAVALLMIIGGLGWCFYRALAAEKKLVEQQVSEEVGN